MAWPDRLRQAAYTSPKGTRIRFDYEAVSREVTRRGTVFDFPLLDESYVQQAGHSSRRYPLRVFFWGADHDRIATAFEVALLEPGIGRLEHPLYGTFNVVPFGDITRRDDLKSEANQTVVEVTFWTTLPAIYPQSTTVPQSEILASLGRFDVAAAQRFADAMKLAGVLNQANSKATIRSFLKSISASLESISGAVTSVNQAFRSVQREINFGMDVLIGQPLLLAQQISNLIKLPGRAIGGIGSRLDAYGELADRIFGSDAGNPGRALTSGSALPLRTDTVANDFHTSDLVVMSAVAGSVNVVVGNPIGTDGQPSRLPQLRTKPDALNAADALLAQFEAANGWRDEGLAALQGIPGVHGYQVDAGESYQELHGAVFQTLGHLVAISFSLIPERRIVLDRPRTIIDLAGELYRSVDDETLDFIITTNNLTGSEILELGRGRSILYYPE